MTKKTLPVSPWFWLLLTALLAAGIAMRLAHFQDVRSRGPDERVYSYFAGRIAHDGFSAVPSLFAGYEANVASRIYPGPTRFGHLPVYAAAMKFMGDPTPRAGATVSLVCSVLSLLLCAWMGLRFFTPPAALFAVAFLASSVGELGMARRAWQDAFFGFLSFVLVYVTCEIARRPRDLRLYAWFYSTGVFCLITKENAVVPYGICGLCLFAILALRERSWKAALPFALGGLASIGVALGIFCLLAGSPRLALSVLDHALWHQTADPTNWTARCCSGPWYQFSYLLWMVGPIVTAAALLGAAVFLLRQRISNETERPGLGAALPCLLITFGVWAFASFYGDIQNLRMFSPADGTLCLLAGIGMAGLLSIAHPALGPTAYRAMAALVLATVAAGALHDYGVFRSVVVATDMQELPAVAIIHLMEPTAIAAGRLPAAARPVPGPDAKPEPERTR